MRRHLQRDHLGSQQKPAFQPPCREPIPALSSLPPFQERHAKLRSEVWRLHPPTSLTTPRRKAAVARNAACKAPRSTPEEPSGSPAWGHRTQVTYALSGSESVFCRPRRSKNQKGKKGMAEGGANTKVEPRRPIVRFSSVPDLTPLAPEYRPEVPRNETAKAKETIEIKSTVAWFLPRTRNRQAPSVAGEKHGLKLMCKSLDMSPLPKDDSVPRQVTASRLKEEPIKGIKTKPKPRRSSKGLYVPKM